jgi:hypothetical protein
VKTKPASSVFSKAVAGQVATADEAVLDDLKPLLVHADLALIPQGD